MLGSFYKIFMLFYVIKFQNLIGMLGRSLFKLCFFYLHIVSKPYRYARKLEHFSRYLTTIQRFQNLIGMLGSFLMKKKFFFSAHVSKPYRYARKFLKKLESRPYDIVSKPYRYARKFDTLLTGHPYLLVSKPYRYARKSILAFP